MAEESVFLLHALFTGMFITVVYDGLIILRRVVPHRQFVESLEDLGFWIFCAVYVFLWLYRESNGTLRWYAIAGAVVGMFLYKKPLSGILVKGTVWLLQRIFRVLGRILRVLGKPFCFLGQKLAGVHSKMRTRRRKLQGNFKIKLKSYVKALKIKLCKR